MTTSGREAVRRHASQATQYLENGLAFLQQGEAGKAGELLWGSVAEAVHALAASRGTALRTHRSLRNFASAVAREIEDRSLAEGYRLAEGLHSNFYEVELDPEDIQKTVEPVRNAVGKLLSLIPPEALTEPAASS